MKWGGKVCDFWISGISSSLSKDSGVFGVSVCDAFSPCLSVFLSLDCSARRAILEAHSMVEQRFVSLHGLQTLTRRSEASDYLLYERQTSAPAPSGSL